MRELIKICLALQKGKFQIVSLRTLCRSVAFTFGLLLRQVCLKIGRPSKKIVAVFLVLDFSHS